MPCNFILTSMYTWHMWWRCQTCM